MKSQVLQMLYFWWGCRVFLKLFTLQSESVKCYPKSNSGHRRHCSFLFISAPSRSKTEPEGEFVRAVNELRRKYICFPARRESDIFPARMRQEVFPRSSTDGSADYWPSVSRVSADCPTPVSVGRRFASWIESWLCPRHQWTELSLEISKTPKCFTSLSWRLSQRRTPQRNCWGPKFRPSLPWPSWLKITREWMLFANQTTDRRKRRRWRLKKKKKNNNNNNNEEEGKDEEEELKKNNNNNNKKKTHQEEGENEELNKKKKKNTVITAEEEEENWRRRNLKRRRSKSGREKPDPRWNRPRCTTPLHPSCEVGSWSEWVMWRPHQFVCNGVSRRCDKLLGEDFVKNFGVFEISNWSLECCRNADSWSKWVMWRLRANICEDVDIP